MGRNPKSQKEKYTKNQVSFVKNCALQKFFQTVVDLKISYLNSTKVMCILMLYAFLYITS